VAAQLLPEAVGGPFAAPGGRAASHYPRPTASHRLQALPADYLVSCGKRCAACRSFRHPETLNRRADARHQAALRHESSRTLLLSDLRSRRLTTMESSRFDDIERRLTMLEAHVKMAAIAGRWLG
jgi:hypothetical protein